MLQLYLWCFVLLISTTFAQDGCKMPTLIIARSGYVESPYYAYPLFNYPANLRCRWTIRNPVGNNISISFADWFWTEGCSYDYVNIYDTDRGNATICGRATPSFGPFCGGTAPGPFVIEPSNGTGSITVEFCSDSAGEGRGFHLTFNATDDMAAAPVTSTPTSAASTVPTTPLPPCGTEIFIDGQSIHTAYIESPNYPANYPPNLRCQWNISAPAGDGVLEFTAESFQMESCNYDYLSIEDPNSNATVNTTVWCTSVGPKRFRVQGNQAIVRFRTDGSVSYSGFRLQVRLTKCRGEETPCPNAPNGNECFLPEMLCDGNTDCPNGEDERCPAGCGIPNIQPYMSTKFEEKIVGGIEARPHSFPWHVAIFANATSRLPRCAGSIIDHNFVLTAGSCCSGQSVQNLVLGVGEHILSGSIEPHAVNYTAQRITIHPNFRAASAANGNIPNFDYCLIKTSLPIFFNDHVTPVCLGLGAISESRRCYLAGWGSTDRQPAPVIQLKYYDKGDIEEEEDLSHSLQAKAPFSSALRQVDLRLVNQDECRRSYASLGVILPSRDVDRICAGGVAGKGGCVGDQGGALVCQSASDSKTWEAIGVYSSSMGCADRLPGIFARVSAVMDWISTVMFS